MSSVVDLIVASALSFECVLEPPRNVIPEGNTVSSKVIGLPPEMSKLSFGVEINKEAPSNEVKLDWPNDPIRAGKAAGLVAVGPQDYSFISFHSGPCLFTVRGCLFLYTLSIQPDQSAVILVQPAALSSNDSNVSKPFQVFMAGRCLPKGRNK